MERLEKRVDLVLVELLDFLQIVAQSSVVHGPEEAVYPIAVEFFLFEEEPIGAEDDRILGLLVTEANLGG
ncbi:hypothetical protein [Sinorhizobium fredii]|uniref:hypothetical protein n=1 Tax=Rhizobium fredii TaxID=380 RepID=UPI001F3E2269|nr:hypothetical protein [Sinorhizobium fredii]